MSGLSDSQGLGTAKECYPGVVSNGHGRQQGGKKCQGTLTEGHNRGNTGMKARLAVSVNAISHHCGSPR